MLLAAGGLSEGGSQKGVSSEMDTILTPVISIPFTDA